MLWDAAQSININTFSDRLITNIVQVDLSLQVIQQMIVGVWDVINDILLGVIVDRTRTRWGKFRSYLLGLAIPRFILTVIYWLMPILFAGRTAADMTKFISYVILTFTQETVATFQTISRNGMTSTITPHPVDRMRLITLANFASGTFGEKLPQQITTVILDLIDNSVINFTSKKNLYAGTFVGMGVLTAIISSSMSMWFFLNLRERVMQTIKPPQVLRKVSNQF